jgi:SAM-dependent methyltransferase
MDPSRVLEIYDDDYAGVYDDTYLTNTAFGFRAKTQFELAVLRSLTGSARSWLDIACGTGYFLQHVDGNRDMARAGLDLSPAMVRVARARNPEADIRMGDCLDEHRDFSGKFDVTSCLWGAYGLLHSEIDIQRLIANLARWTSPGGACFMPIFDPAQFLQQQRDGTLMPGVKLDDEGTRWSFVDWHGKTHEDVLAPPVDVMLDYVRRHFALVELLTYPGDAMHIPMRPLVAWKSDAAVDSICRAAKLS